VTLPTISVVTVCLNDQRGLKLTFDSLASQTSPPRQWIVADGGSHDGTPDWLASNHWPPLAWTSERDSGIYFGMNRGLSRVDADYVLFLNSGDTLAGPDVLAWVTAALADHRPAPALLYGHCLVLESDNRVWLRRARPPGWTPVGMPASHQAMFFGLDSIRAGYDIRYRLSADYALVIALYRANRGHDFLRVDRALCQFQPGGRSDQQREVGLREDLAIRQSLLGMSPAFSYALQALHEMQWWIKRRLPSVHRVTRYQRS
jgi:putative colanic acid biosynthesis glycosyltransferase